MGSVQKKELEVPCKLKKEMHVLPVHCGPVYKLTEEGGASHSEKRSKNCSTVSLSQDICKQSNGALRGPRPYTEWCLQTSQTLNLYQLMRLSSFNAKLDQIAPSDPCQERFSALEAALAKASILDYPGGILCNRHGDVVSVYMRPLDPWSPKSTSCITRKIVASEMITMLHNERAHSGDQRLACKLESMPNFLDSIRKQKLSLSNLTVSQTISLANMSGSSSLLNILNYFPHKAPPMFCSRKKLLILDINGILADIVYPPPKGYKADTKIAGRAVFARPFCSDFLKFCLERFNVAIWSSRSRKIIDRLLNYLMGDMKHKLIFCWDLSHCTASNFRTLENKHKALVFKELRKVWESYDPDLPWEKGYFNESNTLLLDDTPYKALLNPAHTAVFPYSYEYKNVADTAIGPGGAIRAYLEELAAAENVQKYIEKHPFGQGAITERSLSWQFYDKVIKEQSAVPAGG